jgi:hypothetical protein
MILREIEEMSSEVGLDGCEGEEVDEKLMPAAKVGQKGDVIDHVRTFVRRIGETTFQMRLGMVVRLGVVGVDYEEKAVDQSSMAAMQAREKVGAEDRIHTLGREIGETSLRGLGSAGADNGQAALAVAAG